MATTPWTRTILTIAVFFLTFQTEAQVLSVSETVTVSAPLATAEFTPSYKFSGDFRYRAQTTREEPKGSRKIHRILLRLGQAFQIQQDLKFTYRLMTGSVNNNGNATLGEQNATQGSPRYSIGLDQAFITYLPEKNLSLYLGKMQQFFYSAGKNFVVIDRDITPEGLGVQYSQTLKKNVLDFIVNLAGFWVREKYDNTVGKDLTDTYLSVVQGVLNYKIDENFSAHFGVGLYTFTDVKGSKPNDLVTQSTSDFRGNTADASGNYLYDYEMAQSSIELRWIKSPLEISLFFEHLKNGKADRLNEAQIYGLGLSYEKFSLSLMRQAVENDAVLAIYASADVGGQTGLRGNVLLLGYRLNKNAVVNFSHYNFDKNVETTPTDYKLSSFDVTVTF